MAMWTTFTNTGASDPSRESGLGSDSDNMAELAQLLQADIPEGRNSLSDSHVNLERVAEYCEGNYFQAENKRIALEETKNYTTQSLASVAYQINTLAYNFLQLLDLQTVQLSEMESQINHIAQNVMIHKEKVARREIGVLTANKTTNRQYKIIAPANPEKPIKYVRKPIDFTALDDIGHGIRSTPRQTRQPVANSSSASTNMSTVGPAPTNKPPTPPAVIRATGTLSKSSREYRTPPAVAPPQVPSHYAPNYPIGHTKREKGPGYNSLPMHHTSSSSNIQPAPIVGMVHPMQQSEQSSSLNSMPPPPSPHTLNNSRMGIGPDLLDNHHHQAPSFGSSTDHYRSNTSQQLSNDHYRSGASQQSSNDHYRSGASQQSSNDHYRSSASQQSATDHYRSNMSQQSSTDHYRSNLSQQQAATDHYRANTSLPGILKNSSQYHPSSAVTATQQGSSRQGSASPPLPPPPEDHFGHISAGGIVPQEPDLPGWVPKNYLEKVIAIYDYYADKDDELSFQENAVIYVLKKNDDGWWEGVMDGITGLFPGNYVEGCM
ncbi:abl interactor 2 [Adelges cooleyi]|uniref:abl interactor 2 n=1 Tax=Adelges cooleyi TaxID=133065 RepID=UPI00217FFA12|nr:abl interactor 2 [Adelges cooleyi]